jgi:hypothetical protein
MTTAHSTYLTRAEARKRLAAGKKVYASYYNEFTHQQCNVLVTDIIDRGYGNYAICSDALGVSNAMAYDRIAFSTRPMGRI